MTTCNVLLSSAGRRVALLDHIRRDLADLALVGNVVATDMTELSAAAQRADRFIKVPPVSDPKFSQRILDVCSNHAISLLIPTIDSELSTYARLRGPLAELGTLVLVSGPETVSLSGDKRATNKWLRSAGFPTPEQWSVDEARQGGVPLPVIAKPAQGSASMGVRLIATDQELQGLSGADLVVQRVAEGVEYTVDVWVDSRGAHRCSVPRRRMQVRAGEVSKGITDAREDVVSLTTVLAEALPDPFGPLTVQLFAAPDGAIKIIEINPRFGGGYPLAWEAGARYPRWALQETRSVPYDPTTFRWRDGLVMLRYDDAVFVDQSELAPQ